MFSELIRHPRALGLSVAFHLILFAAIFFNFHLDDRAVLLKQSDSVKTVKAKIVDSQVLEAQKIKKQKQQEAQRKRALEKQEIEKQKKRKQLEQKKRKIAAEKKKKEDAKRAAEAKKLADLNKKKLAEKKKKQQEQLKQQQEVEKQKKIAEQKRIHEEQLAIQAEQKRLEDEKLKQQAEQRRLAEEEVRRRQQEIKAKQEAEESQRKLNSLLQAYRLAIKQKIERNWRQPQESGKMPDCEILVIQGPGGIILDVSFGACQGGSPAYRLSIENAVRKSDPLPKPGDPSLFERELIILFNPE